MGTHFEYIWYENSPNYGKGHMYKYTNDSIIVGRVTGNNDTFDDNRKTWANTQVKNHDI